MYPEKLNKEIIPSIVYRMNVTEIFYMHDKAPVHYTQLVPERLQFSKDLEDEHIDQFL
jgi:hypothetical protein